MKTIRTTARERMAGFCRVCPVCDGRACAGQVPGMGGLGTGSGFRANLSALAEWRLNMRVLHEAGDPDPTTRVLDIDLAMPVMAAPIGGVAFNMGGAVSEQDYIASKLKACHSAGIIGCTGDGVPAFIHEAGFAAISELDGHGIPFVKPWEDAELDEKLDKALATGARVVGMDVDAAGLVTLRQMGRPVSPKSPDQIRDIIARTPARFVLKGIMTADQAHLAVDAGAAAIVVSNHGGRVLDHTPGAAEVLPEIAQAVSGQVTILADGGIRSGADVLKMVALGADAVMVGRPFSVAAVGGLEDGVKTYIEQIRTELISAMVLTGCRDLKAVGGHVLRAQASKFRQRVG